MDLTLLIVAIVSLAIGYFGNSFLSSQRGSRTQKVDHLPSDPIPNPEAAVKDIKPDPGMAAPAPIKEKSRLDMATFWREQPSGALRADMDGRIVKSSRDLSPEQRRRLVMVASDLASWLTPPTAVAANPLDNIEVSAESAQAVASRPVVRTIAIPAAPAPLPTGPDGKPAEPKSIVAQIDDILQDKLVGTPLEDRRIRLLEMPGHGVAVKIGIDQFASIDEVPDREIQSIIRAAVKIWEGRAG